jgi:hypothetical protein
MNSFCRNREGWRMGREVPQVNSVLLGRGWARSEGGGLLLRRVAPRCPVRDELAATARLSIATLVEFLVTAHTRVL